MTGWAKAFAIWFAHERPAVAAIANVSGEYVAQHYRAMLPMRQIKPAETDETVFGLAHAFIDLLTGGADKEHAFLQVLADFETDRGKYERAEGASPIRELDAIWERYRARL